MKINKVKKGAFHVDAPFLNAITNEKNT